jgi:hypothetical protein
MSGFRGGFGDFRSLKSFGFWHYHLSSSQRLFATGKRTRYKLNFRGY